jgi:hypothetical protein
MARDFPPCGPLQKRYEASQAACYTLLRRMRALIKIGIVGIIALAVSSAPDAGPAPRQQAVAQAKKPVAPDWPNAETLEANRADADRRKLFASQAPLAFTLTADFAALESDRTDTTSFPGTIAYTRDDGSTASVPLRIRARGHERRMARTCEFVPLRLEFQKDHIQGTVFEGQKTLKLVVHCREERRFEQYVPREYAVYKILSLITPRAFRVRLGRGTYVDASSKATLSVRSAFFLEEDGDLAKRLLGKLTDQQDLTFSDLDPEALTTLFVFEYMIGNTDVWIPTQHNVKIVTTRPGVLYPVPYDFDYSGAVNTVYAVPDPKLPIGSVRDRLYRGPCRTPAELEVVFNKFRAVRPGLAGVYDAVPDFNPGYRKEVLRYFDDFYKKLDNPSDVKKIFIDKCAT